MIELHSPIPVLHANQVRTTPFYKIHIRAWEDEAETKKILDSHIWLHGFYDERSIQSELEERLSGHSRYREMEYWWEWSLIETRKGPPPGLHYQTMHCG